MTALTVLTERNVRGALRDDLPFAVLASVGNFVVFNLALRNVIDAGGMDYSQYVLPVIIVQVTFLGALTTVDRAARDQSSELGVRLRTMPIPTMVPLMARMLYCLFRGTVALVAAVAVGYALGFRLFGGFGYAVAFVALVLLLTLALSLGADATGVSVAGSEIARSGTSSQLLLIPQTMLVMLSTGMAPTESFPNWLHPFVTHQPVSQVTETLRGFAAGHVVPGNLAASLAWCVGMLVVFGTLAVRMQGRVR